MAEQIINLRVKNQGLSETERLLTRTNKLLKNQKDEAKKTADAMDKGFNGLRATLRDLTTIWANVSKIASGFFSIVSGGLKESLVLGEEFVRSQARLRFSMSGLGIDTKKASKELEDFAFWMSTNTEASVGQIQSLQSVAQSLNRFKDPRLTNDLVKASVALANVIPNRDAATLIGQLSQSLSGVRTKTLNMIPAVKNLTKAQLENGEAIKVVNQLFAGGGSGSGEGGILSAAVDTVSGRLNNLVTVTKDRWLTTVGRAIFENQAFTRALEDLAIQVEDFAPAVEDLMPVIQRFVVAGGEMSSMLITITGTFIGVLSDLVKIAMHQLSNIIKAVTFQFKAPLEIFVRLADALGIESELVNNANNLIIMFEEMAESPLDFAKNFEETANAVNDGLATTQHSIDRAINIVKKYDKTTEKSARQNKKIAKQQKRLSEDQAKQLKKLTKIQTKHALDAVKIAEKMWKAQLKEQEWAQKRQIELTEKFIEEQEEEAKKKQKTKISIAATIGGETVGNIAALISGDEEQRQEALANLAATAISGVMGGINKSIDLVKQGLKKLSEVFMFFVTSVIDPEAFEKRAESIKDKLEALANPENFDRFFDALDGMLKSVIEFLSDGEKIREIAEQFIEFFIKMVSVIAENIGPILEVLVPQLINLITEVFQALVDNLDTILEAVVPAVIEMIRALVEMIANSDFLMTLVSAVIDLVLGILEVIISNLPQILSNVVKAVLQGIGDFIEGIIEMLAEPEFLSKFVVGVVNLIFDLIEGIAKMAGQIVKSILKNIIPIVYEVFRAVVRAIGQIFLRGMWAVLRIIVKIITLGRKDIGSAPGTKGVNAAAAEATDTSEFSGGGGGGGGGSRTARFHNGGVFKFAHNGSRLAPGERIIAQDGEAMVIPIGPKKFGGMSTDGRGNIAGGGSGRTINITINAVDAQSFRQMMQKGGLEVLIDLVDQNVPDGRNRLLKRAINS